MGDAYQSITEAIVRAVEAGAAKYEMPWHRAPDKADRPRNVHSNKPYSGINVLMLWLRSNERDYRCGIWGTYLQWAERGCSVRQGEKGTRIVYYRELEPLADEEPRRVARTSHVFAAEQVSGYAIPDTPKRNLVEIINEADAVVSSTGALIHHGGERAFYSGREDAIYMPESGRFIGTSTSNATEAYYSVLLHELTHWTGHKSRLDRFSGKFTQEAYAHEELVAELGAAFLCADLSVTNVPRLDHAAYVSGWLQSLSNDSREIFRAAGKAQRAAEFVLGSNHPAQQGGGSVVGPRQLHR